MFNLTIITVLLAVCADPTPPDTLAANHVFQELLEKGVAMSDGKAYRLPSPSMGDNLSAESQKAVIEKIAKIKNLKFEDLVDSRTAAPTVVSIRTLKESDDESSIVRAIDLWFVARGKWEVLNSKEFLDSLSKAKEGDGNNEVISKSGSLTDDEMEKRGLKLESTAEREERFVYTTFSLFDQVELSATRLAVATRSKTTLLGAAKVDPRFSQDAQFPNRWRPILRDASAEISYGKPQPYSGGAAYAKLTKLQNPADGIFVECHLVYEEPYGWFEGGNMLNSKLPTVVKSRVRIFRSKLGIASEKK